MADIYELISIVAFSLAGLSLVAAVFFWFRFHIWALMGDLSGRTARKTIARMRAENEKTGPMSPANLAERGVLGAETPSPKAERLAPDRPAPTPAPEARRQTPVGDDATAFLHFSQADITAPLSRTEDETAPLSTTAEDETVPLSREPGAASEEAGETALLRETDPLEPQTPGVPMRVLQSIVLIHTDEVI